MRTRAGTALVVAFVCLTASGLAACTAPEGRTLPPPSSTSSTVAESTTTEPDYSQVALAPFPGETTTTAPIRSGNATLRGEVVGPDGGVADAVVRFERLVGDAVQRREVRTGADGRFVLPEVAGGRYRARAFQAPTLTMTDAEVFFLADGDERDLRLDVEEVSGLRARAGTTPSAPVVGDAVNLAIRIAERSVDGDGVIREVPLAGVSVVVRTSGWAEVDEPDDDDGTSEPGAGDANDEDDRDDENETDADGIVVRSYRCDRAGSVSASVTVAEGTDDEETLPLEVPACAPRPTTTTTTDEPGDEDGTTTSEPDTSTTAG